MMMLFAISVYPGSISTDDYVDDVVLFDNTSNLSTLETFLHDTNQLITWFWITITIFLGANKNVLIMFLFFLKTKMSH